MIQILASSRIVLLNSESEGTPRILAEGLLLGKPCAVPQALTCGLDPYLNDSNCLRLSPSGVLAAAELSCALDNPASMAVDRGAMRRAFSEEVHKPLLMERLSRMYGDAAEEAWELDDLHTRLACHGEKQNYQIMNSERAFLDWFARVEAALSVGGKMDEDTLFPNDRPADRVRTSTYLTRQAQRVKRVIALKRASVG